MKQTNLNKIISRIIGTFQNQNTLEKMACIDDDWENFLTQGTIILSDEKKTAKKNINKVYSENDKISQSMNNMSGANGASGASGANGVSKKILGSTLIPITIPMATATLTPSTNDDLNESDDIGEDEDDIESTLLCDVEGKDDDEGDAGVVESEDNRKPKCSNIYISTKTKISYLNMPIDIKRVFWNIPISPYSTPSECIIKKQIKVSTTDPEELKEIKELLKKEKYYQEQEIEHIDNPEGRIKFKVQLKINVGLCKKDILNYRCKLKRAFFNCFVLIMRIKDRATDSFKEMHLKVFNTGKLEIPGIQTDESLTQVLDLLISILKPIVGDSVGYIPNKCETVLINSNFNCGYFINRDKLYNILKYKYRINSNYDACSYPGIQSKFYYILKLDPDSQTGQQPAQADANDAIEISFMIFRTGSVLIVGRCDEYVLHSIYNFLKKLLETEYPEIGNKLNIIEPKKNNVKLRRKIINVVEDI